MVSQNVGTELRALYDSDEAVKAVCDMLSTYQRGMLQIMTHRVCLHLDVAGYDLSRSRVISAFRALEEIGLGKYIEGRHGWKSRFAFVDRVTAIPRLLQGEDPASIDKELDAEDIADRLIEHTFNLRPDMAITIELPADLTENEAQRLSQFVGCLAFNQD